MIDWGCCGRYACGWHRPVEGLVGGLADVAPVEDDLAGVTGAHGGEALFVVAPVHAMGDDSGDIEAGFEHDGHHVPGLVHFAAVDATDGELIEDDLVPVDGDVFGGDAEHGDFAAVAHVGEHIAEGVGVAGHFEAYVEALLHAELLLEVFERGGAGIDGAGDAYFFCEGAAVLIGVGDDDVAGTGVAGDSGGHDADGTGAGDEDVFSEDGEGEGGVDGVAEGIEDRGDFEGDAGGVLPDIGHGQDDELGEGSVAIDSDTHGVGAEVAASGEAVAAASADDVTFAADDLADGEIFDVGAGGDDFADELVADGEALLDGGAGPGIPLVDVEVGATDAGVEDTDFYVVDADLWFRDVLQPEAAFCAGFYESLHGESLSAAGARG